MIECYAEMHEERKRIADAKVQAITTSIKDELFKKVYLSEWSNPCNEIAIRPRTPLEKITVTISLRGDD